jgi:hypothetical protein
VQLAKRRSDMKKLAIFVVASLFLFFLPFPSYAQVGVGITSYSIPLRGNVGDIYYISFGIMNPSSYTTKVSVYPECDNCVNEVKLFGFKLFDDEEILDEYFKLDKDVVDVPPLTTQQNAVPVTIKFAPKLVIKKNLVFYTPEWLNFFIRYANKGYAGSFKIPYFTLLVGTRDFKGRIVAEILSYDGMKPGVIPSVASTLEVHVRGMPFESFVFLVLMVILIVVVVLRKIGVRRIYRLVKRKKS